MDATAPDTPARPSLSRAESAPPTSAIKNKKPHMLRQASYRNSIPHDKMPYMLSQRFASVVLLEVSGVHADYLRPWQKGSQNSWSGSGFAIEGRRIMTNYHVTSESTDIRIRKHGSSKRFRGRVVCQGQDVDLAVVEVVEDADTFGRVPAVSFAQTLPPLQSSVNVVGYPTGGRTICVTEGVVSRVDCKNTASPALPPPRRADPRCADRRCHQRRQQWRPCIRRCRPRLRRCIPRHGRGCTERRVRDPRLHSRKLPAARRAGRQWPVHRHRRRALQCDSSQNKSLRKFLGVPPGVAGCCHGRRAL